MDRERRGTGWILNSPPSGPQCLAFYQSERRLYSMVFWKFSLKFLVCSFLKSRHPEGQILKSLGCCAGCPWPGHGEPLGVFLIKSVDHINVLDESFVSVMGHGLEIGRVPAWKEKNVWCKTVAEAGLRAESRGGVNSWVETKMGRGRRGSGWCHVPVKRLSSSSIVPTNEMGHTRRKADLSKAEFGELMGYPVRNVS